MPANPRSERRSNIFEDGGRKFHDVAGANANSVHTDPRGQVRGRRFCQYYENTAAEQTALLYSTVVDRSLWV